MIRQARQIASVYIITRCDGLGVEAFLAHHLLAVHCPALGELGGVNEQSDEARMRDRRRQLLMMSRVRLVDAGVVDRRVVVLAHRPGVAASTDGVTTYKPLGALPLPNLGGVKYAAKGQHVAQILGCLDDRDRFVRRQDAMA